MMLPSVRSFLTCSKPSSPLFVNSFRLPSVAVSRLNILPRVAQSNNYYPAGSRRNLSSQEEAGITNTNTNKRLEYQHSFHAGNFADVVKHVILVQLLQHMQKKSKPIEYVETHAGAGMYRLETDEKDYETEHQRGIYQLLDQLEEKKKSPNDLHPAITTYLKIFQSFQEGSSGGLIYPGSPLFAASLLKQQELNKPNQQSHSMLLYEKAPAPHAQLQLHLGAYNTDNMIQTQVHCGNGYTDLARHARSTSNLPGRALILIDPPYQYGSDTDQIVFLVEALNRHWKSARVAIWHPVRQDHAAPLERLYSELKAKLGGKAELLAIEVYPPPVLEQEEEGRKEDVGTGMILIQPPFGIDQECKQEVLPQLLELLSPKTEDAHKDFEGLIHVERL